MIIALHTTIYPLSHLFKSRLVEPRGGVQARPDRLVYILMSDGIEMDHGDAIDTSRRGGGRMGGTIVESSKKSSAMSTSAILHPSAGAGSEVEALQARHRRDGVLPDEYDEYDDEYNIIPR